MVWVGADGRRAAVELAEGRHVVLVLGAGGTVPSDVAAAASAGNGGRLAVFVDPSRDPDEREPGPPPAALELAAELFGRPDPRDLGGSHGDQRRAEV